MPVVGVGLVGVGGRDARGRSGSGSGSGVGVGASGSAAGRGRCQAGKLFDQFGPPREAWRTSLGVGRRGIGDLAGAWGSVNNRRRLLEIPFQYRFVYSILFRPPSTLVSGPLC